ncbi:MAG: BatD family protein [Candidatus Omnitrophica bacterium]|nr:BatD family protein [Candidatus Omnitrophota bacterium]MCF7893805.1 BatD family protein [Candidatus Omnitrophota bacterium]
MSKLPKLFFIILGVFVFLGFFHRNSENKNENDLKPIKVEISKNKVATGEIFSYLITIEGKFENPKLQMPDLDQFKVVSTKKTKSFSYQKDKLKTTVTITYFLFCPKPGSFTIEPVKLIDNNKTHQSKSFKIIVTGKSLKKKRKIVPYIEGGTKI